jgi:hypothetical protein
MSDDKDTSVGTVLAWVVGILLAIGLFQAVFDWSLFHSASDTPTYQDPGVAPGQETPDASSPSPGRWRSEIASDPGVEWWSWGIEPTGTRPGS